MLALDSHANMKTIELGSWALCVALAGCSANDSAAFDEGSSPRGSDNGSPGSGAPQPGAAPPGEEQEVESLYEAPVATGRSIWVANPKSGRVAYIDASSLSVTTIDAGDGPSHLAAIPGRAGEAVIVLNERSQDATLIERTAAGAALATFPVAAQANSWAIAKSGRVAVAWADARLVSGAPETEGFQELTVLDTEAGAAAKSTVLAVGYRPLSVGFDTAETRAYAVTQDGIVLIDLTTDPPALLSNIPLGDDPLAENPLTRDVVVTPDGAYAFVRRDGKATIEVLRLADGARATITLPGAASDLDLTADGARAVAVLRGSSQVALLPVPAIFDTPGGFTLIDVPERTVASVVLAPATELALLFTNATPVKSLTIVPLGAPAELRTVRLYSPVLGVFPAPGGRDAVVLHTTGADGGGAFSLVRLDEALPARIAATQAPPFSVAVTNEHAIVTERDDRTGVYAAQIAKLATLAVDRYPLASPPLAAGVVVELRRAYVSQAHPDGRITFFDLDTGLSRTLTGFELGARVVDGSAPTAQGDER